MNLHGYTINVKGNVPTTPLYLDTHTPLYLDTQLPVRIHGVITERMSRVSHLIRVQQCVGQGLVEHEYLVKFKQDDLP